MLSLVLAKESPQTPKGKPLWCVTGHSPNSPEPEPCYTWYCVVADTCVASPTADSATWRPAAAWLIWRWSCVVVWRGALHVFLN